MAGVPEHFTANVNSPGPLAVPTENTTVVQSRRGVGLAFPARESDCSGQRPSWFPFQVNVCDWELDPVDPDLTPRQRSLPPLPEEG